MLTAKHPRASPACLEQGITGDDRSSGVKQQQEQPHRQRLDLGFAGRPLDPPPGGADGEGAKLEIRSSGKLRWSDHAPRYLRHWLTIGR